MHCRFTLRLSLSISFIISSYINASGEPAQKSFQLHTHIPSLLASSAAQVVKLPDWDTNKELQRYPQLTHYCHCMAAEDGSIKNAIRTNNQDTLHIALSHSKDLEKDGTRLTELQNGLSNTTNKKELAKALYIIENCMQYKQPYLLYNFLNHTNQDNSDSSLHPNTPYPNTFLQKPLEEHLLNIIPLATAWPLVLACMKSYEHQYSPSSDDRKKKTH